LLRLLRVPESCIIYTVNMYSYQAALSGLQDLPDYAELHCLSNFSFQRGAAHPEELVRQAAAFGMTALAITDECSLAGVVRAHQEIKRQSLALKLIIGAEIRLADGPTLVLLATDRIGYGNLARLISRGRRAAGKGDYRLTRADIEVGVSGCLAVLVAPEDAVHEAEALQANARWLAAVFPAAAWLAIGLYCDADDAVRLATVLAVAQQTGLPAVAATGALMHDASRRRLADVLAATRLRTTVAETGLRLASNAERRLHPRASLAARYPAELLAETVRIAARCRFSLDELRYEYPDELVPVSHSAASWLRHLVEAGLRWRYAADATEQFGQSGTREQAVQAEQSRQTEPIKAEPLQTPEPLDVPEPLEAPESREATEADQALEPFEQPAAPVNPGPSRPCVPPRVRALVEHELALIAELAYEAYFLTVHDIVRFARSRDILCQGRGSAANSVVCWALGITEVNPELGIMLVERFISRERNEPPDIDVDFEHERREEVIQYIYAKYGRERAALAATVICYRPRSALRDVGRALGFPLDRIERLTRDHFWFDGRSILPERLREAGLDPDSPTVQRLVELTTELIGFPRHLSQHVGGFVIARGRLDELVPIENAAMADRTVIQWDKDDLDALGLLKIDVLALGMLSALRRSLALVSDWRKQALTLADIPREAPAVYEMLSNADSVGVFQVESRAQMTMLPRLQPRRFYDLVVEVAIVRPGPIQGGMVHPYLEARARAARGEAIDYPRPDEIGKYAHDEAGQCSASGAESITCNTSAAADGDQERPDMAPFLAMQNARPDPVRGVLERTLGVPIFQEQVMQLAVVAAGFTPGEADQLRRSMGAWRRKGELERYRERLLAGMAARGYCRVFAERLCRQIEGFGSYGFPESHAASFALLVYFSAWLKCFEPAAFLCGLLNSQPMGFYAPSQLIQDARRHDVVVLGPDVTASEWDCTLATHAHPPPATITASAPNTPTSTPMPTISAITVSVPASPSTPPTTPATPNPAVRLGLLLVKGLGRVAGERIVAARRMRAFESVDDLAARAALEPADLKKLAAAGALSSLAGHRRQAVWQAAGGRPLTGMLAGAPIHETPATLSAPAEAEDLLADYARLGFTLGRHPLALLRTRLAGMRFITAADVSACADRQLARSAGIVTCRQRPGTAKGTMFVTLEDETGLINVIVRTELVERQRRELLGARLLGVYGQISRQGKVVHLQASRLVDHSALLGALDVRSRDFQ
jgi:error-prone DNA polymerase